MSQLENKLSQILIEPVEALGFELLGVEFVRAGKHSVLRVYIDHEDGIDIDDCAEVSHQVSAVLDVEDPISVEYNLEVSSPGMDRPLFKEEHYHKAMGEMISIRLRMPVDGRRNFKGVLLGCNAGTLSIKVDNDEFKLDIDNIDKGNLVPSFD